MSNTAGAMVVSIFHILLVRPLLSWNRWFRLGTYLYIFYYLLFSVLFDGGKILHRPYLQVF
jgi:hypothetical protein